MTINLSTGTKRMKKQIFITVIIIIGFAVCNLRASANFDKPQQTNKTQKEYFVAVTGDDANDGSESKPFRTISAAAKIAQAGDIITVHAGTYREGVNPIRGGESDLKHITYQAAKGEKVEIKGSEIVKNWHKVDNNTWKAVVPNSLFGDFNPYTDLIHGDWFNSKGRQHHTGCVYLNGNWLMEAATFEEVTKPADENNPLWFAKVDSDNTTIWVQFAGVDPNKEFIEINVRPTVFYPEKPFINFITVRGFIMRHAATSWAPPTAEQKGLIGTHWSKGWIIENNIISHSKCSGVALGKYGDEWDNKSESAEGYVGTINRALANKWNKETIGGHIVRNNHISFCEQTGIVGSMGCAFSTIQGNIIHDIHMRRLFSGAEMAGIKFHGAVDVQIMDNHIYRTNMAVWLDWMAQGAQVKNNLLHDNLIDVFLEVDHGPMLVSNNIMLSPTSLLMNSSGAAFMHNLFAGTMNVVSYDARLTPYHKSHSTEVVKLNDNPSGDIQFVNNLFVKGGSSKGYDTAMLALTFNGNVYLKGSEISKQDKQGINKPDFDADIKLVEDKKGMFLEINLDKSWLAEQKRILVSTDNLGKAIIPDLPFENPDGTPVYINADWTGKKRNSANPSPGPFEIIKSGKQKIKVIDY